MLTPSHLMDEIVHVIARLRPSRMFAADERRPLKVNLGAGFCVAPGWIHLDGSVHALCARWPEPLLRRLYRGTTVVRSLMGEEEYLRILREHEFVHHALERPLPFADGTVDYLYSSHVLEHFYRQDAERLLAEARRVLRPGGVLRLAVPDLEHAVERYLAGEREEALDYFFHDASAPRYRRHRFMYDYPLLEVGLRRAGFSEVQRRAYREGAVPDLDRLDNRPDETLFVEAVR